MLIDLTNLWEIFGKYLSKYKKFFHLVVYFCIVT